MVITSKSGSIMIIFLLTCFSITARAELIVSTDNNRLQLGKYLLLRLTYSFPPESITPPNTLKTLDQIDTRLLEKHFHVEKYSDVLNDSRKKQISWKIRLYPYVTGALTIPSLRINGHKSRPLTIHVTRPIDLKTGLPINVQHQTTNTRPWTRQQIQFLTSLTSKVDIRQLKIDRKSINHLELVQIKALTIRNENQNTVTTGWAATVQQPGLHSIKLPPVKLIRDGVITHLFYPPPVQLDTKALPVYVPATIPVGEIFFSNMDTRKFVFQDALSNLDFSLRSNGINEASIPDISHHFKSTNKLRFYPKQVSSELSTKSHAINVMSDYKIPFKVLRQGISRLPAITLTYFDPESGTLKSKAYPGTYFFSINSWLYYAILVLVTLVALWMLINAVRHLGHMLKSYVVINQAIKKFRQVQTREDLRQAMRLASQARGHQKNITPRQWLHLFHSRKINDPKLEPRLNRLFYQADNTTESLVLLAKQLEQYYKQSIPIIRWF